MLSLLGTIMLGAVILLLITAALAPLESLGWWAGWFGDQETPPVPGQVARAKEQATESSDDHFLVYLSGIGAIDARAIPQEEIDWATLAVKRIPQTTFVADVYPYSVTNTGLTTERVFSRLWNYLGQRRLKNPYDLLQFLINIRNMFQMMISADRRYGPFYNLGVANEIMEALEHHGYPIGSGKPVTLLGFSGGAQVSLGASSFLGPLLEAPLRIISIGGFLSDDVGIKAVGKIYHLWGQRDPLQGLAGKLYAGRWRMFPNSDWNQAVAVGKIVFIDMGQMHHNGSTNYFSWTAFTPEGQPHAVAIIDTINNILVQEGLVDAAAVAAAQEATDDAAQTFVQQAADRTDADKAAEARKKARAA